MISQSVIYLPQIAIKVILVKSFDRKEIEFPSPVQPEADTDMQRYLHPSALVFPIKSYDHNTDVGPLHLKTEEIIP